MSSRKSSIFYGTLIGLICLVAGMVIASRLDLTPASLAGNLTMPATNSAPLTGTIDATTFRTIAHDQSPAVVSIITTGKRNAPDLTEFFGLQNPFGRRGGGGGANRPQEQPFEGAGSGFIIDGKAGYILTNNHVVEDADDITVMLADVKNIDDGFKAKVIGRDKLTDSALIQLVQAPKAPLPEVKFGDSSQIAAGDWVMAIGNPFTFANTVTVGVVSAVGRVSNELNPVAGRDLEYIQTDAAINKGNSGGPLLNIRGEVVGMNTAIISDQGGNIGIGFAVPVNTLRDVLPQLKTGKVERGRIGVSVRKVPMTFEEAKDYGLSAPAGAVISTVDDKGPAKAAGIHPGDVITEYNGKPVKDSADLVSMVTRTAPGTSVPVKVMRNGKPVSLSIKVEELNVDTEQPLASAGPDRSRPDASEGPKETGFGMTVEPISPRLSRQAGIPAGKGGAIVSEVTPLSSASRDGIVPGDVILSINGQDVASVDDVTKALGAVQTGRTARILVWRPNRNGSGDEVYVPVKKR